jgi:hypothetical protein
MTYLQAVSKAERKAKVNDKPYFVVYESGEYEVASEFDLDTWFAGVQDNNILYCTADGVQ